MGHFPVFLFCQEMTFKLEVFLHTWSDTNSELVGLRGAGHMCLLLFMVNLNFLQVTRVRDAFYFPILMYHWIMSLLLKAQHRYPNSKEIWQKMNRLYFAQQHSFSTTVCVIN